ncbi:MAG: hypothetical protein ACXACF_03640 [Candidatus Hermodarchaeia archaeon]
MSDEGTHYNPESPGTSELLHLGYLIQNQHTHPFALTFQDLTNLLVLGSRAEDIYYNLLIQLSDDKRIPVLVIKGQDSSNYEDQVCERPLWHLNLTTDAITFNTLALGQGNHPSRQITILISLFEEFAPLSPSARNLLHVILWKTLLTTANPSLTYLKTTLPFYKHHKDAYLEVRQLLDALPPELMNSNFDNISLSRIHHLPTIITGDDKPLTILKTNLLMLKLLAQHTDSMPPLFMVDPPPLNSQLLRWLCLRYADTKNPLVIFDSNEAISAPSNQHIFNYILTHTQTVPNVSFHQQLSANEQLILQSNNDHVAVWLRSEPTTRIISIF